MALWRASLRMGPWDYGTMARLLTREVDAEVGAEQLQLCRVDRARAVGVVLVEDALHLKVVRE